MAVYIRPPRIFYDYYHISKEDDDDESENSGSGGKELKSSTEHSHSLFGIIWSIQRETGWSQDYILWGESWLNLQMKLSDAPRMVSGDKAKEFEDDDELLEFLNNT